MCSTADALAGKVRTPFGTNPQKQTFMGALRKTSGVSDKVSVEEQTAMFEMQQRNGEDIENRGNMDHSTSQSRDMHLRKSRSSRNETMYLPQQQPEKPEDYSKDWKKIAEIFDRLFFWLFLLAIVISTLILFHPLTKPIRISNPTEEDQNQLS